MNEIQLKVENIFKNVLKKPNLIIKRENKAQDIEGWDSLKHIMIIVSIEKEFKVKLKPAELVRLKNIGDLLDLINVKCNAV